jgi:hypothetical protein
MRRRVRRKLWRGLSNSGLLGIPPGPCLARRIELLAQLRKPTSYPLPGTGLAAGESLFQRIERMLVRLGQEPFLAIGDRGELRQRLRRDPEVELRNIVLRNDHQDAIGTGQGVTERNPEGRRGR